MPWDVPPYPPYTDKADVPLYLQSLRSDLRSLLSEKTHTHVAGSGAGQINVINSTSVLGTSASLAPSCKLVSDTLANYVTTSGNVTITGTKTFSSPVVVPASTADTHAVNQGQIASLVANTVTSSTPAEVNNLLINGEFVVNQRGQTVYDWTATSAMLPDYTETMNSEHFRYCVDGWKYPASVASASPSSGFLYVYSKTTATDIPFIEQSRDIAETPGRISDYVVQVEGTGITSVELIYSTGEWNSANRLRWSRKVLYPDMSAGPIDPATGQASGRVAVFTAPGILSPPSGWDLQKWAAVDRIHVRINLTPGNGSTAYTNSIKYAKLLRGKYGVPHVSEEYSKALLRCHRRYFRTTDPQLGTAVFTSVTGDGYLTLLVPAPMRAAPTFRATNSTGTAAPVQFYGSGASALQPDYVGVLAGPLGLTASSTAVTGSEMIRYDGSGPGVSVNLKGPGTSALAVLTSANVGKSSIVVPGDKVTYEFEAEPR